MTKLIFIKTEDKKGIFKHPRRTNYFLPKRRTCPPKKDVWSPYLRAGMWKRLFFKRFRFHIYRFRIRFHRFRFHQQKTKKRPLTTFFNFCGFVACLLLHFIILRKQKPSFTAITLPTLLELIVSNYSVFVFLRYQNSCWM